MLRDRCQEIVVRDHAHPEAIGLIDESGIGKSGSCTAGAARQYNGNHGKIENCVVGVQLGFSAPGFQMLRGLLRVAFGRWAIEAEFRVAKEELGLDHFEVRGGRCIHRHYFVTGRSFLLCSRTRRLTVEQVRRSIDIWLQYHDLPLELCDEKFQEELDRQRYHQQRNAQAKASHTKTRVQQYLKLGIHVHKIKSCIQTK